MSESITNSEDLNSLSVSTDQLDYAPGSTVNITLTGLAPGASATFQIADLVSDPGDDGDADTYQPFTVTDGGEGDLDGVANGVILTAWTVPTTGDPDNATLSLTATSGDRTATMTFTDAAPPSVDDFLQWENGGRTDTTPNWVGGNLNSAGATYFEGDVVPQYVSFSNLEVGKTYTVVISYDTTKAGTHAYDYLTTFDSSYIPQNPAISAGVTDTIPDSTFAIPDDPNSTVTQDPGVFTAWNANITGTTAYAVSGTYAGDSTTTIGITFTATSSDVVLAFGAHIASEEDWGAGNSAAAISGSPYHVSLVEGYETSNPTNQIGGFGSKDNQLQTSVVINPGEITVIKEAAPPTDTPFQFTFTSTTGPAKIIDGKLDLTGDGVVDTLDDGTFTISSTTYKIIDGQFDTNSNNSIDAADDASNIFGSIDVVNGQLDTNGSGAGDGADDGIIEGAASFTFSLTDNSGATNPSITFDDVINIIGYSNTSGTFTITETNANGYSLANIQIIEDKVQDSTVGATSATIKLQEGEKVTITFKNEASPELNVVKDFALLTDADNSGDVSAGDTIRYSYTVTNTGTTNLTGVSLVDDLLGAQTLSDDADDGVGFIAAGDSETATEDYVVQAADLGTDIVNIATADSDQTGPDTDTETVPVPKSTLSIVKTNNGPGPNGTGGWIDADGSGTVTVGDTITYSYAVTNTGGANFTDITLSDNKLPGVSVSNLTSGLSDVDGDTVADDLAAGATATGTATYVIKAADVGTTIINTATADSDQTGPATDDSTVAVPRPTNFGQVTPTGTTANQYINGTAVDFEDYYASQGGVVQYGVKSNKISSTNPGVFFYYTGASSSIMSVAGAAISVYIDQSDDKAAVGSFSATKGDVKLWRVNDLDNNGIDPGDTVTQVKLSSNQVILGTGANAGDVTVNYDPAGTSNSLYVVSVQYSTGSVVGTNLGASRPTVNYTFTTNVNGGAIEETSNGITLAPKVAALTLDGPAGEGANVLSDAQLDPVIAQAIQYWDEQGASGQELAKLRAADVKIADLGGATLAATDGSTIWIDDDAAGQGWSLGQEGVAPGDVDLYSAVVHEYGHLLGYDHDVMGASLAVGERIEPLAAATNDDDLHASTAVDWLSLSELPKIAASLNAWHNGIFGHDHGTVIGNSPAPNDALKAIHNALDHYGINFANDGDFQASDTHQTAMQTFLQSLSSSV